MNIVFPTGSGIKGFVYWLVAQIMGWGWVSYAFAIVFFTLFIKLMLSPLDFLNRFLSRRTQMKQQALAGEVRDLEQIYKNDPIGLTRARQALYQKNGVGGTGSALIAIVSLVVTMVVFFQVMGALNDISNVNIQHQYQELQAVYREYMYDADTDTWLNLEEKYPDESERAAFEGELSAALNAKYKETTVSAGWIKNLWQPDSPFASSMKSADAYNLKTDADKAEYKAIFGYINAKSESNGWFILAVLSAVTIFLSMRINMIIQRRTAPQKPAAKKEEPVITYSLRDAKERGNEEPPMIDPAQMTKMMSWMMPIIYIIFATMQTSAFAIYMIASSFVSTALSVVFALLIGWMMRHMKQPEITKDFDAQVINPHAKYFKGGKK